MASIPRSNDPPDSKVSDPNGGAAAGGDLDRQLPNRVTPRECIRAARDALSKAYGCGGRPECWPFVMAAIDWQRRAVEQLAEMDSR